MEGRKPQKPSEGEESEPSTFTGRGQMLSSSYRALRGAVSRLARVDDFYCDKIGCGFFSDMYKVQHRQSGQVMVLKINKQQSNRTRMLWEVELMNRLSHPNILRYMGACVHMGQLYPLVEYVNGGNLEQLLDSSVSLPWSLCMKLVLDIAYGMHYLHSKDIVHRDLTSKNCLVRRESSGYTAVVGDFGLAEEIPVCRTTKLPVVGSPYWMAPEMLRGELYDETADVFSFGIIICEIVAHIPADPDFMPRSEDYGLDVDAFCKIVEESCPEVFFNLALECCTTKPTLRPSFLDITRCLEDMLYYQRCSEEDMSVSSDAEDQSGVAGAVSDWAWREMRMQPVQLDQSRPDTSASESSALLLEPPKEAATPVHSSLHEDLKKSSMKFRSTPSKVLSRTFTVPSPFSRELLHYENLPLGVWSPHPATDSPFLAFFSAWDAASTSDAGEAEGVGYGFDSSQLTESSTSCCDNTHFHTAPSHSQHNTNKFRARIQQWSLPKINLLCTGGPATAEQTEPAALPFRHYSTSALDQHEPLPCSSCHQPTLRLSSTQTHSCEAECCICHDQKGPGPVPAEPEPKLPEDQS